MRGAAVSGILAFGVLADDDPVEGGGCRGAGGERGGGAGEDAGWADIGVELEGLDDRESEGPEGDVVWDVCIGRISNHSSYNHSSYLGLSSDKFGVALKLGYAYRVLPRRRRGWH